MANIISKLALLVLILFLGILGFVLTNKVFALDPGPSGITFPIAELGNCGSLQACHIYCESPDNQQACLAFKNAHNLGNPGNINQSALLAAAKAELGCDSAQACHDLCEQPTWRDRCIAFAKAHGLNVPPGPESQMNDILQKAKQFLGCNSLADCKAFCDQAANHDKCNQFAQSVGLRGGNHLSGPGGCNTPDSCRAYCSDPAHHDGCQQFMSQHGGGQPTPGGQISGPGGCNSQDSCRLYCQTHQTECQQFLMNMNGNPGSVCGQKPGYHWTGTDCVPN